MRRKTVGLVLCIALLFALTLSTGCARKAKPVSPTFAVETTRTVEPTPAPIPGRAGARDAGLGMGSDRGLVEGDTEIIQDDRARQQIVLEGISGKLKPVYFDYDRAVLKAAAKAQLERNADVLKENPKVNCQIEGHCDERGDREYNLALGEKRALAARRYLISLGINPDRLFTISYGEERPVADGHDESAWKLNRRGEFKATY
jgi:peptidoglycan-associated lipoprotein